MLICSREALFNDTLTAPRGVVGFISFLSVVVPYVVSVLLIEFIFVHFFGES